MSCKNCVQRANSEKYCIYVKRHILTLEDAYLNCLGCRNYTACNGFMKRSWGWNNGKEDFSLIDSKIQCDACGMPRHKNVKRNDMLDKRRLKCERCNFVQFQ